MDLLSSLRYRGFVILWLTYLTSSTQFWMELVARPWLVYQMTDSVLLLGAVQAVRGLPVIIFAAVGGILADRMDRQRLLVGLKAAHTGTLAALTVLLFTGRLEVWQVFALTLFDGMANAMEFPIRQSLIPSLVPQAAILNALALNQMGRQVSHVASPSLAGVLIAAIGIGGCYAVQTALALVAAVLSIFVNAPRGSQAAAHESIIDNVASAIRYVKSNQTVLTLIILALAPNLLVRAWQTVLPVFARDVLNVGEVGFGLLNSATGAGSLVGAVVLASLGSVRRKGAILLTGAALQGVALILFAFSESFPLSVVIIGLVGVVQTAYFSMNNALLLTHTSEDYRGRVLSIYDMDRGLIPLSAMLLGWMATVVGTPAALALLAAPIIPLALGVLWRVPRFRNAE